MESLGTCSGGLFGIRSSLRPGHVVLVEEVLQGKRQNYKAELLERKSTVDCFTAGSGCSPALVPVWLPLWLLPLLAFSHTPKGQTPSMELRSTTSKGTFRAVRMLFFIWPAGSWVIPVLSASEGWPWYFLSAASFSRNRHGAPRKVSVECGDFRGALSLSAVG